jgi:hypothetical protein
MLGRPNLTTSSDHEDGLVVDRSSNGGGIDSGQGRQPDHRDLGCNSLASYASVVLDWRGGQLLLVAG